MVITYPIPMWGDSSRVGAHEILMVVQTARMVVQYDVIWRVMVFEGQPWKASSNSGLLCHPEVVEAACSQSTAAATLVTVQTFHTLPPSQRGGVHLNLRYDPPYGGKEER